MNSYLISYAALALAILFEIVATSCLKQSQQFTQWLPTTIALVGYGIAFYLLSISLRTIPVGIAYAIWSGVGIVLISIVAWIFFKQHLDLPAWIGISLIMAGVIVINVFSKSSAH